MRRLAEARVVDADTVDGQHGSAFALKADLPTTGGASCAGNGFYPFASTFPWQNNETRTSNDASVGTFTCPLDIPHGATITTFMASLDDRSVSSGSFCSLWRMDVTGGLLGAGNGTFIQLAQSPSTVGSSGDQVVSTSTITNPVVDARRYAHYALCTAGNNQDLGINGVVVHYTLP